MVFQAGAVVLVETVRKAGWGRALSRALAPWRRSRAVHDLGKVVLDLALAVALGGACLADVGVLRTGPDVFGPVASDPTVSRLVDVLAVSGSQALEAVRRARSQVRARVWEVAGPGGPDAGGSVTVDIDGVLVLAHCGKQDAAPTWKKTFGHHPLVAFVDHGSGGTGGAGRDAAAAGQRRVERRRRPHSTPPVSRSPDSPPGAAADAAP